MNELDNKKESTNQINKYKFLLTGFTSKYLVVTLRILLGGLFVLSGIMKLLVPREEFFELARQFQILPDFLLNIYAFLLPWVELIFGLFLVLGFFQKFSTAILGLVLVSFLIAVGINLGRGIDLECGCFGSLSRFLGGSLKEVFWRDIILLIFAVDLFLANKKFLSLDKLFERKQI